MATQTDDGGQGAGVNAAADQSLSLETLSKAADLPVLDHKGKEYTFGGLHSGPASSPRVLVVFIRHFFCGACQAYTQALSESIIPEVLLKTSKPTSIILVGCGSPSLIDEYVEMTSCRFPIYTDPTGKLFDALGMLKTMAIGTTTKYAPQGWFSMAAKSVVSGICHLPSGQAHQSGDPWQVGGEFIFEAPEKASNASEAEQKVVTWFHRMQNHRDHTEIPELRKALGLEA